MQAATTDLYFRLLGHPLVFPNHPTIKELQAWSHHASEELAGKGAGYSEAGKYVASFLDRLEPLRASDRPGNDGLWDLASKATHVDASPSYLWETTYLCNDDWDRREPPATRNASFADNGCLLREFATRPEDTLAHELGLLDVAFPGGFQSAASTPKGEGSRSLARGRAPCPAASLLRCAVTTVGLLRAVAPAAKHVFLIREPTERLLSEYNYFSAEHKRVPSEAELVRNVTAALDFDDACRAFDPRNELRCAFQVPHRAYYFGVRPRIGLMATSLKLWLLSVPPSSLRVYPTSDMGTPAGLTHVLRSILRLADLPEQMPFTRSLGGNLFRSQWVASKWQPASPLLNDVPLLDVVLDREVRQNESSPLDPCGYERHELRSTPCPARSLPESRTALAPPHRPTTLARVGNPLLGFNATLEDLVQLPRVGETKGAHSLRAMPAPLEARLRAFYKDTLTDLGRLFSGHWRDIRLDGASPRDRRFVLDMLILEDRWSRAPECQCADQSPVSLWPSRAPAGLRVCDKCSLEAVFDAHAWPSWLPRSERDGE